jgi:hypothetical protein
MKLEIKNFIADLYLKLKADPLYEEWVKSRSATEQDCEELEMDLLIYGTALRRFVLTPTGDIKMERVDE